MNVYLIRHGQTKSNGEGRYIGFFEDELSVKGINEIQRAKIIKLHHDIKNIKD